MNNYRIFYSLIKTVAIFIIYQLFCAALCCGEDASKEHNSAGVITPSSTVQLSIDEIKQYEAEIKMVGKYYKNVFGFDCIKNTDDSFTQYFNSDSIFTISDVVKYKKLASDNYNIYYLITDKDGQSCYAEIKSSKYFTETEDPKVALENKITDLRRYVGQHLWAIKNAYCYDIVKDTDYNIIKNASYSVKSVGMISKRGFPEQIYFTLNFDKKECIIDEDEFYKALSSVMPESLVRIEAIKKTKYSKKEKQQIIDNKIWIGMSKKQLELSWGTPDRINETYTSRGVHSQYVYGYDFVYIENGKVTSFQLSR